MLSLTKTKALGIDFDSGAIFSAICNKTIQGNDNTKREEERSTDPPPGLCRLPTKCICMVFAITTAVDRAENSTTVLDEWLESHWSESC